MTRKATAKKPKKPAKPKPAPAYVVVRELRGESPTFTEPDRVFADRKAAQAHADELNRQLRTHTGPFQNYNDPDNSMKGGERAFLTLVKKLKLPVPKKEGDGYSYINWEAWWDRHYFDMTEEQRDALWDALDKFDWYHVQETELEG
jgi:hypothetical protein